MRMSIVQVRNDAAPSRMDPFCLRTGALQDLLVGADGLYDAILDGQGFGVGNRSVECRNACIKDDRFGCGVRRLSS